MGLPKGRTNNKKGRPKGTPNRVTKEIRLKIDQFITDKIAEIDEIWKELEPKDKFTFLSKLLEYTLPKLRSQELNISEYNNFSTDELKTIANEIVKNIEENE